MSLSQLFIKEFTKELINNSSSKDIYEIIKISKDKELKKEIILHPVKINENNINLITSPKIIENEINIPLPPTSPSDYYQGLYLGKLTLPILNQSSIEIECSGPDKYIIIRNVKGTVVSNIMLSNQEIEQILNSFSEKAKIPRIGGIFKAIVNNLIITAIESNANKPRFIISKMSSKPSQFL